MKNVEKYADFNEKNTFHIKKVTFNNYPHLAICRYKTSENNVVFLPEATFTFVAQGEKYMLIDNKEYYLKSGDLLYLPKNSIAFSHIVKPTEYFESINILLSQTLLQSLNIKFTGFSKSPFLISQEQAIISLFRALKHHQITYTLDSFKNQFLQQLMGLCASLLFKESTQKTIHGDDLKIITQVLTESVYQKIPIDKIAEKSNMSLSTFKRKFESIYGLPPKTWLRNICLQAAYFYLKTEKASITEVSSFIGFENPSHFSYAFKKYFKQAPSAIIKMD